MNVLRLDLKTSTPLLAFIFNPKEIEQKEHVKAGDHLT